MDMLSLASGKHTGLISLYIPFSSNAVNQASALLKHELTTAVNIKSRSNRKSVQRSIQIILNDLSTRVIPNSGIALFAGEWYI
jgi:peptide subunit release factor 1 (eRF1)